MDTGIQKLFEKLQQEIERWEDESRFWEDPRVIELEDISGSKKSAKELTASCKAMADEWRRLIKILSS